MYGMCHVIKDTVETGNQSLEYGRRAVACDMTTSSTSLCVGALQLDCQIGEWGSGHRLTCGLGTETVPCIAGDEDAPSKDQAEMNAQWAESAIAKFEIRKESTEKCTRITPFETLSFSEIPSSTPPRRIYLAPIHPSPNA